MLNKLNQLTILLLLTVILCTVAYATPINKVAFTTYLSSPAENTEQYKVTINKGNHVNDAHLELLPNSNGEYWVPKGYSVKVNADCDDGYQQTDDTTYVIDSAKTVELGAEVAPPQK